MSITITENYSFLLSQDTNGKISVNFYAKADKATFEQDIIDARAAGNAVLSYDEPIPSKASIPFTGSGVYRDAYNVVRVVGTGEID